jgi:LysR family transcriptional regulator, hydrogen peroxide-inducible genes activator
LLRQDYPDLDIELREAVTGSLIEELAFGRIDVMIAALPIANSAFESEVLFTDRFLVAVAENDRDALHGPVAQENFAPERLLLLEEGHCLRDQALDVCGAGSRRLVNFGATSLSTLLQLVSNGLGMTLIPEIAVDVERQRNSIRILRFEAPEPSRTIGMIWRKSSGSKADIGTLGELIRRVHVQAVVS